MTSNSLDYAQRRIITVSPIYGVVTRCRVNMAYAGLFPAFLQIARFSEAGSPNPSPTGLYLQDA